jgi:hypothetical protein
MMVTSDDLAIDVEQQLHRFGLERLESVFWGLISLFSRCEIQAFLTDYGQEEENDLDCSD